ncbi:MAG: glycosyltransferase family 39 protein [Candidatus Omnitrophica bacterium]|nr:glycosyltransferase family 39 protein [Candidatus Omnitrophota bacterium]
MHVFLAVGQVLIMVLAARRLGLWLNHSRWNFEKQSLQWALEISFGWILLWLVVSLLSALSLVSVLSMAGLFIALSFIACWELFKDFRISDRAKSSMKNLVETQQGPILILVLYGVWIVLCSALPATTRDELIYHLEIPKRMLEAGGSRLFFLDNIYAYFPQMGEMLMLFHYATGGEVAAKLLHGVAGSMVALALYGFSHRWVNKRYAFWGVLLFLSIPSVMVTMSWAYVDLIFTLYAFLALVAICQYDETHDLKWIILSGLLAGASTAVKYTGYQLSILFVIMILLQRVLSREGRILSALAGFLLAWIPFALIYPLRNYLVTGWPLYPFQVGSWGLDPLLNWDPERARLYLGWLGQFGTPLGSGSFLPTLLSPVLVFIWARFNEPEFYEGVIGPAFLLLPLVLWRMKKPFVVRFLMIFSIFFLFSWALTTKQARFLFPVLPVLCFLLMFGLSRSKIPLIHGVVMIAIFWGFYSGAQEVLVRDPVPYWAGAESRQDYLRRQLPHYEALRQVSERLGEQDRLYLVNMKNYGYFLDCPWRSDFVFERYSLDRELKAYPFVKTLEVFFRQRGISHLLVDEEFIRRPVAGMEPQALSVFEKYLVGYTRLIYRHRHFSLYELVR